MKKFKKLFAVILSLAMVMGMSVTTFAAPQPTLGSVTIGGVEAEKGVTVEAYKIISYDESGKYVPVIPGTISTVTDSQGLEQLKPNGSDIETLYHQYVLGNGGPNGEKLTLTTTLGDGDKDDNGNYLFTPGEVGSWLIVVKGASDYVYNPAIVSISREPSGYEHGILNFADNATFADGIYVKKSEVPFSKTAVDYDKVHGVQYGDIIQFEIKTTIPSYQESKKDLVFEITDTLTGLQLVTGRIGENNYDPSITISPETDVKFAQDVLSGIVAGQTSFKVVVGNDDFLHANAGGEVTLTYYAQVTSNAQVTVDALNNTATLKYSTDDGENTKTGETHHYTFGIDTQITGEAEGSEKSGEFFKVNEDGDVQYREIDGKKYSLEYIENENGEMVPVGETLGGAVFELHIGSATGALFTDARGKSQFTTTSDGRLEINGLDSDVTYYLVETKAPAGYTVNATPVEVKFDAKYNDKGILEKYTVTIGENATHYAFVEGKATIDKDIKNPHNFKNTKLASLPSTGGIGTTIFTIGGCAIMIIAAALFFASRRKSAK